MTKQDHIYRGIIVGSFLLALFPVVRFFKFAFIFTFFVLLILTIASCVMWAKDWKAGKDFNSKP